MKKKNVYHGYLGLPRQSKLLMYDMGYALFGFYLGLIMEAIWDRRNPDFKRVIRTQKELSEIFHCSQSTISRCLKFLESKRYLIRHTDYILLKWFPLFLTDIAQKIHSKDYADLHELCADLDSVNAELNERYANSNNNRSQNATQRLYSSSKDNISSFPTNSNDEYIDPDDVDKGIEELRREREGRS